MMIFVFIVLFSITIYIIHKHVFLFKNQIKDAKKRGSDSSWN